MLWWHAIRKMSLFQYKYLASLCVPIFVCGLTVLAKKIARARIEPGWKRQDLYLGIDQTIAAFAVATVNVLDFLDPIRLANSIDPKTWKALLANGGTLLGCIIFLFLVLSFHLEHESNNDSPSGKEIFWVGAVSNAIGFGLLFATVLLLPTARG